MVLQTRPSPAEALPVQRVLRNVGSIRVVDWECPGHDHGRVEWAARNEIAFVRSGAFLKRVGAREVTADPGTAIFFSRGEEYRIGHHRACGDRCVILVLPPAQLEEMVGRPNAAARPFFPSDRAALSRRAVLLLRHLTLIAPGGDPLEVEETALRLAGEAIARAEGCRPGGLSATEGARRREVEKARAAIAARSGEPLGLAEIARETAYSPWHLARVFREVTGRTLHQHLTRVRLLRALDLLGSGFGLSRIALDAGFSSHSHFSAAFRREFGAPPSRILSTPMEARGGSRDQS